MRAGWRTCTQGIIALFDLGRGFVATGDQSGSRAQLELDIATRLADAGGSGALDDRCPTKVSDTMLIHRPN